MGKDLKNKDLLKEVAKSMPVFGKNSTSHIMWDAPGSQLSTEMNSVLEFASNEKFRSHLAQAAWAYKDPDNQFIADRVAPFYPVNTLTGQYRGMAERTFFDRPATKAGKDTPPSRIDYESSLTSFDLNGRALAVYLSRVDLDEAKNQWGSEAKLRQIVTMLLTRLLLLDRELTVAAIYQTPATYFASGFYATASPLWSVASSVPRNDKMTAEDALYAPLDLTIVPHNVYRQLQKHSDVRSDVQVSTGQRAKGRAYVNQEAIENYLDCPIVVGSARYNSTPEDPTTVTMTRIWADYVTFAHLKEDPGGAELSTPFCRTFKLRSNAFPNWEGWTVKSIQDSSTIAGGEIIMCGFFSDEVVFAQKAAYSLKVL